MILIKDYGKVVKNKDTVNIYLQMVIIIKDNLSKEWDTVKVNINGLMGAFMMDNGKLIKWMEKAFIEVLMDL